MCPSAEYNVDEKITSFAFVWIVNRAETTYKVSKFPYNCDRRIFPCEGIPTY